MEKSKVEGLNSSLCNKGTLSESEPGPIRSKLREEATWEK